ncbi:MAG: hypothetical protein MJ196_11215 [Treponemataceae bacterium]|nr:hypothetical protein [Treponemataceae bacterium]
MKKITRLFAVSIIFMLFSGLAFAIPGIIDFLPTNSGSYVYYRDYTYPTETYIGFLLYDQNTYALRYVSPKAENSAKSICLYVTVDPNKSGIELTGEHIEGEFGPADVETLNYLHDLLYELSARRKELNGKNFGAGVKSIETYPQFGGEVSMEYAAFVPFFNLCSISSTPNNSVFVPVTANGKSGGNNKNLFSLAYTGALTSDADTSFTDFNGVPDFPAVKQGSGEKIKAPLFKQTQNLEGFSFKIDKNWQPAGENTWTLGEQSILNVFSIQFAQATIGQADFVMSVMLCPEKNIYPVFDQLETKRGTNYLQFSLPTYSTETGKLVRNLTGLYNLNEKEIEVISITVDEVVYQANRKYFDSIINSSQCKK